MYLFFEKGKGRYSFIRFVIKGYGGISLYMGNKSVCILTPENTIRYLLL